jgi:hypothetical protein
MWLLQLLGLLILRMLKLVPLTPPLLVKLEVRVAVTVVELGVRQVLVMKVLTALMEITQVRVIALVIATVIFTGGVGL